MKLSLFEQKLRKRIEDALPGNAPGLMVQVHHNGRKVCDIGVGDTYAYYDLASLTKIIFTTQAMMHAFQLGKWNLKTRVQEWVDWFPSETTTLTELMNHSAGMLWWAPFYRDLDLRATVEARRTALAKAIQGLPIVRNDVSVYSDLDFLVLGFALEKMFERSLLEVWGDIKQQFYPRLTFDFHPDNVAPHPMQFYAPTEKCPWRHKYMQGEVHDENTWALGGVSSHAGLFGSIDDLGWFGLFVRGQLLGISRTVIKQKTAQMFASRSRPVGKGDWALGYMMPTPGSSSSGDFFSVYSIGHTGFTGTSFWYDPAQDLGIGILSNRLAFGRENDEFKRLRPQIHNWIVDGLRRV